MSSNFRQSSIVFLTSVSVFSKGSLFGVNAAKRDRNNLKEAKVIAGVHLKIDVRAITGIKFATHHWELMIYSVALYFKHYSVGRYTVSVQSI